MGITLPIPRYTVKDYLLWEGRWELWDGHPVAMSPSPGWNHQRLASRIHLLIGNQLEEANCDSCEVFYGFDWHVDDCNVVRPDLSVVCDHSPGTAAIQAPPALVVEILSPSNPQNDLLVKRSLYESQGVPFYLILDPEDVMRHELLVLDKDGSYQQSEADEWTIEPHPGCELTIPKDISPVRAR